MKKDQSTKATAARATPFATLALAAACIALCLALASCDQGTAADANGKTDATSSATPKPADPARSDNASLASLALSVGTLTPAFAPGTTAYGASVGNATTGITVTPTASASSAAIEVRVNGGPYATVASGSPSGTLALKTGTNAIDVKVTAESGTVTSYAITVTRALSPGTGLSALTLSTGTLSPAFAPGTTAYGASVPDATTGITVTPTASAPSAAIEVRVNGGPYATVASGFPSAILALAEGKNAIDVRVTAENADQATYTVTVTRMKTISKLTLDFKYGDDGNTGGGNIYVAWIEKMDGTVIQNLCICEKLLSDMKPPSNVLTNTALPYWSTFKYDQNQIDGVSGATKAKQNFTVTRAMKDPSVTKFKVCFETDRSWDKNDWFDDQPATLYSATVDLADAQDAYALTLEAWTPNEGTVGTLKSFIDPDPVLGKPQTTTGFITNKKDPSTTPTNPVFGARDTDQSSTCFVKGITLKIE